jgi:hypothetical protein
MLSHAVVYFAGVLSGALALYFGESWTDMRRERWATQQRDAKFHAAQKRMPALLDHLRSCLAQHPEVREFVVLPNGDCLAPAGAFVLLETTMPGATEQAAALANAGHIHRVAGHFPRYQMVEPFAEFLRAS